MLVFMMALLHPYLQIEPWFIAGYVPLYHMVRFYQGVHLEAGNVTEVRLENHDF